MLKRKSMSRRLAPAGMLIGALAGGMWILGCGHDHDDHDHGYRDEHAAYHDYGRYDDHAYDRDRGYSHDRDHY